MIRKDAKEPLAVGRHSLEQTQLLSLLSHSCNPQLSSSDERPYGIAWLCSLFQGDQLESFYVCVSDSSCFSGCSDLTGNLWLYQSVTGAEAS